MFKAFGDYWKNYFNFKGRTRRKDFWLAVLAIAICGGIISALLNQFGTTGEINPTTQLPVYKGWATAVNSVWSLINFIPGIALFTRRMHDTGKRFWYILWELIPIVGFIIVLVRELKAGDSGDNRFGADPKAALAEK